MQSYTSTIVKILFWGEDNCYRDADELGAACYKEVVRLLEEYGTQEGYIKTLTNPINYGFEVYVEGELVTSLSEDSGGLFFLETEGEYFSIIIYSDGSLIFEPY